jgi:hypothetical protein
MQKQQKQYQQSDFEFKIIAVQKEQGFHPMFPWQLRSNKVLKIAWYFISKEDVLIGPYTTFPF